MDLIYTDKNLKDLGVLKDYTFDLAFGADENDFECTVDRSHHCLDGGFFLYIEGTEYGGIVDDIKIDTDKKDVIYHGRTWHGFLDSKCIVPLKSGEASTEDVTLTTEDSEGVSYVDKYLIVSGEVNKVIGWIIDRVGLSDMFEASTEDSEVMISKFQFDRYCMAYEGIVKMLKSVGMKMKLNFVEGKAIIHAEEIVDYSQDEQFDSDLIDFTIKKFYHPLNHVICLGKGELDERTVIHLYSDSSGNISHTQSLTGLQEVVEVYDYSSTESEEELEKGGIEKLQEAWNSDVLETDFNADSNSFDIGDIVGAIDHETGMEGKAEITKKIVTIQNNIQKISYKVGEE